MNVFSRHHCLGNFSYNSITQAHIRGGPCENVFDFALVFTVYSPNVTTECEQFINKPLIISRFAGCCDILLSTAGQYIIYLQTHSSHPYNFYLTRSGSCESEDTAIVSLHNKRPKLGKFLITRYVLPLQFNKEPIPAFHVLSLESVFNISIVSLTCTLDIFYERRLTLCVLKSYRRYMVIIYV